MKGRKIAALCDRLPKLSESLSQYSKNSCFHSKNIYLNTYCEKVMMLSKKDASPNINTVATLRNIQFLLGKPDK